MQITTEDEFFEAMARTLGYNLPRMAGRIWAYLAICEPPEQTAGQIAERLQASRGSVSGMARLLEHLGLISRGTKPGDRREYFSIPPRATDSLMERAQQQLRTDREVTEAGLALIADRSPESRARLQDLHDLYALFEEVWPSVLERYHQKKADAERIGSRKEVRK